MCYNPFSLEGKTILVTGASSGIGKITAIECSKMGARVIVTARNVDRLKETFDLLTGDNHQFIISDLSNDKGIDELVEQIPRLDGVSHNAGIVLTKPFLFYKRVDIDSLFSTNTFATVFLVQQLLKKKKFNKNCSIVLTSAAGGVFGNTPGNGIYEMTKSAVDSCMKTIALEMGHKGVRCNSVNPAMVNTHMTGSLDSISQEQIELDKKRYLLGRYGNPEDIAWAIIYFLSDASSWVTGTALKIDGGRNLIR